MKFKSTTPKTPVKEQVKELLKLKLPAVFEREPAPAYAEGNLNALIDQIDALYS